MFVHRWSGLSWLFEFPQKMLLVSSLFKEQETILVLSGIGRWHIRFRMLVLWIGCLGYSSPGSSLSCLPTLHKHWRGGDRWPSRSSSDVTFGCLGGGRVVAASLCRRRTGCLGNTHLTVVNRRKTPETLGVLVRVQSRQQWHGIYISV